MKVICSKCGLEITDEDATVTGGISTYHDAISGVTYWRASCPKCLSITMGPEGAVVPPQLQSVGKANDRQVGGDHYRTMAIQPWDFISGNNIPFLEGSIIAYLARWRNKDGIKDLHKARHFLDKLIEVEEARAWDKS